MLVSLSWTCYAPAMSKVDYSRLLTEQSNPRSLHIDRLSVPNILNLMNNEDKTVPLAVEKVKKDIARGVQWIVHALKNGGRLFLAGAGTSGRFGVMEAAECPPTFNTSPDLVQAVMAGGKKAVFRSQEGAEDRKDEAFRLFKKKLRRQDVLVGIAASGVTPFVLGALRAARRKQVRCILISCNPGTKLKNLAGCLIAPKVGPEIISGSTRLKAGTATKLVLNMLTVVSMIRLGKVYKNWMVDLQPKSKKLKARALRIVQHLGQVPPPKAQFYFTQAHGRAKTAILMARKKITCRQAEARLRKNGGFLGKTLH